MIEETRRLASRVLYCRLMQHLFPYSLPGHRSGSDRMSVRFSRQSSLTSMLHSLSFILTNISSPCQARARNQTTATGTRACTLCAQEEVTSTGCGELMEIQLRSSTQPTRMSRTQGRISSYRPPTTSFSISIRTISRQPGKSDRFLD
jgi:hypothetical protein